MKAEDLRTLDHEELGSRLKSSRRELYELRFKLAVGQLDDHRQIRKVRKDIARILTVVHARRLGEDVFVPEEAEEELVTQPTAPATGEETPEDVETAPEAGAEPEPHAETAEPEPAPAPRRRRTTSRQQQDEEGDD